MRPARPLTHALGAPDPLLGRALTVALPATSRTVVVRYRTSPDAEALQWLSPQQTAGGTHPYLFSQGQAILTRTWIPTQDSPGIRQTYRARIVVPAPLRAVMSAEARTPDGTPVRGRPCVRVRPRPAGAALPVRDRHRRHRVQARRPAVGRVRRAVGRGTGGIGVRRPREDDRGGRGAWRAVPVGPLRRAGAAAVVPVRRHGEPARHLRHADDPGRRPVAHLPHRARARAFLVRKPRDQRDVARLLAQRGVHDLLREPDHGAALRRRARAHARSAGPPRARQRAGITEGQAGRPGAPHRPHRPQPGRWRDGDCV